MKKQLVVLLVFASLIMQSQNVIRKGGSRYIKGQMVLIDGSIKKGYINLPRRIVKQNIKFVESKGSKVEKIKTKDLDYYTVTSSLGKTFRFECHYFDLKKYAKTHRITKYKASFLVISKGYVNLYKIGTSYKIDNKGTVYVFAEAEAGSTFTPPFEYYIKQKGVDYVEFFVYESAVSISSSISRKALVSSMKKFLYKYPQLIEDVRSKKISKLDIGFIIDSYNKFMEKKK